MSTEAVIAIAGVLGTLGGALGAPVLTARRERARAGEARDAEQLDELRTIADEALAVLRRASFADGQAILALNPSTRARIDFADAIHELDGRLEDAITLAARLDLRAEEDELAVVFQEAVWALQQIVNAYVVAREDEQFGSLDRNELRAARVSFERHLKRFVARGRALFGPRPEALAETSGPRLAAKTPS
jgi:hypothetical protein